MTRLFLKTTALLLRRLTHTASHPRARLPVYLGLLGAGLAASGWFTIRNHADMAGTPAVEQLFAALIAVALAYALAGPVVLTAELTRDRSGRLEAALASLPLTRRSTQLLVWGPVLLLVGLVLALLLPPTIATLTGAGLPLASAIGYASVSLALGAATAALSVLVVALALPGGKWKVVRAPVAFLLWAAIVVTQVLVSVTVLRGEEVPLHEWLLLPQLLRSLSEGSGLPPGTAIAAGTVTAIVSLGLLLTTGEKGRSIPHGRIVVACTGPIRRRRILGELLYTLRDANVLANLITCMLLAGGTLYLVHRLPQQAHPQALPLATAIILLCAGIPARSIRGAFPARRTPQQAMGMTTTSWFLSQSVVALVLFVLAAAPAAFLPGAARPESGAVLLLQGLVAFGCSTASGWMHVVPNEDSLGQVLATFVYLAVAATLTGAIAELWTKTAFGAAGIALLLGGAALAGSLAAERRRWRYRAA